MAREGTRGARPARPPLLTPTFALILAATVFFFASLNMLNPIFPAFLRERTGATDAMIGVYIGLFAVSGIFLRPLVGRSLATGSRRSFMLLGGLSTAVASFLYLASSSWFFLVPLRLAHGLAIASYYTAASTFVADTAPVERRGEALSYFSMCLYVGLAGGPAIALSLRSALGFPSTFVAAGVAGLLCVALTARLREPRGAASAETVEIERHPLVNRSALFPGIVLSFGAVGYAAVLAYSADFAEVAGNPAGTLYFPTLAASVIVVRLFAGIISDRFGRLAVALPGLTVFAAALWFQGAARTGSELLAAAALAGVGFGFFFPSMLAYTVDRVRPVERGSALATLTGSFDLGFGIGAPALGAIKGASDYPTMYRAAAGFAMVGVVLLVLRATRSPKEGRAG